MQMYYDNNGAIKIFANLIFHKRTKHFEIDLNSLREKIVEKVFKTCKIRSEQNVADNFTKGLFVTDHKRFCELVYLVNLFQV